LPFLSERFELGMPSRVKLFQWVVPRLEQAANSALVLAFQFAVSPVNH
jgi:hypothetical protein